MKKNSEFMKGFVITPPCGRATIYPLSNLLKICNEIYGKIKLVLIYGDEGNDFNHIIDNKSEVEVFLIKYNQSRSIFLKPFYYLLAQFQALYYIITHSKDVSVYFFYLADTLILPMIIVKLLGRKVVMILGANFSKEMTIKKDYFASIFKLFIDVNYRLSDRIILYSPSLIKSWELDKYKSKIIIAHKHFIDVNDFKINTKFSDRKNLVGYIGRLSEEKGTLNFIKAIPEILKEHSDLEFLIVGDGPLRDIIEEYIVRNNLSEKVKLTGWISHDRLPSYMNELKLVVLPSYTEGLPNILLEAMACGTPILATPVGSIPDVITDEETGFILENNSSECIAKNVIRVLEFLDIDKVIKTARIFIESEFTFRKAVEMYKEVF